jgi:uncharacterized protein (TIGR03083 family)
MTGVNALPVDTLVDALASEGARMADAAARADPAAPVPTCPEWSLRDLVRHLGGVHRWATAFVAGQRREAWDASLDDLVHTWPDDDELVTWFRRGHAALVAALAAASDELECWTFFSAPTPRAFWARRQAHETAIHRVDTEMVAGRTPAPCATTFAADGVDEFLTAFVPRRSVPFCAEQPTSLVVRCDDVDAAWLLRMEPEGVGVERIGAPDDATAAAAEDGASCLVHGPAVDLYYALWNRASSDAIEVEGDRGALHEFLDTAQVRWA